MYEFDLLESEKILKKDMANLQCDEGHFINGALYLTTERIVFVGYMLDIRQKYKSEVSLFHIKEVRGEKRFRFFPIVLAIETLQQETLRFIVAKRNDWVSAVQAEVERVG
jgi:hypothetical protein